MLKLRLRCFGTPVVVKLLPGGVVDFCRYDIDDDLTEGVITGEESDCVRLLNLVEEFGLAGIKKDAELMKLVAKALKKQVPDPSEWSMEEVGILNEIYRAAPFIERIELVEKEKESHGFQWIRGGARRPHKKKKRFFIPGRQKSVVSLPEYALYLASLQEEALPNKTLPDIVVNHNGYTVEMLRTDDPRLVYFDDSWNLDDLRDPNYIHNAIGNENSAAYMVSKGKKPVAIAWVWRSAPVVKEVKSTWRREPLVYDKVVDMKTGPIVVIDAIHTIYGSREANKKILMAYEALAKKMVQVDPTIDQVRVQNDEVSPFEVQELLGSRTSPWPVIAVEEEFNKGEEPLYEHPLFDKMSQGYGQTQWLMASRE